MPICAREFNSNTVFNLQYVTYLYCPPEHNIVLSAYDVQSEYFLNNYTGSVECATLINASHYEHSGIFSTSCPNSDDGYILDPVEFFQGFDVKPGYVDHPSFTSFEEYFVMSQEQIDFILTAMLVMTMCVAFCLGFSANESSAK